MRSIERGYFSDAALASTRERGGLLTSGTAKVVKVPPLPREARLAGSCLLLERAVEDGFQYHLGAGCVGLPFQICAASTLL